MKHLSLKNFEIAAACVLAFQAIATDLAPNQYLINQSGSYVLTSTMHGGLVIDADYVTLDLNGYSISGTSTFGIMIKDGNTITIKNGFIDTINGSGIIAHGSPLFSNIIIQNMSMTRCQTGINLSNCSNVNLSMCSTLSTNIGFACSTIVGLAAESCCAEKSSHYGVYLSGCSNNLFINCNVSATTGVGAVAAYYSMNGSYNNFSSCFANYVMSASNAAYGFYFLNESASSIGSCNVMSIVTTAVDKSAYGIFVTGSPAPCIVRNNIIHGIRGGLYSTGLQAASDNDFLANNISYDNDVAFDYNNMDSVVASNQYDHTPPFNAAY